MNDALLWGALIGGEATMFVLGLLVLIGGWIKPGRMGGVYIVRGWPARVMGLLCMLALPLAFLTVEIVAVAFLVMGQPWQPPTAKWVAAGIHTTALLVCFGASRAVAHAYREPIQGTQLTPARPPKPHNDSAQATLPGGDADV